MSLKGISFEAFPLLYSTPVEVVRHIGYGFGRPLPEWINGLRTVKMVNLQFAQDQSRAAIDLKTLMNVLYLPLYSLVPNSTQKWQSIVLGERQELETRHGIEGADGNNAKIQIAAALHMDELVFIPGSVKAFFRDTPVAYSA